MARPGPMVILRHGLRTARDETFNAGNFQSGCGDIRHDRIYCRRIDDEGKMLGCQIRGTKDYTPSDAIEFDECYRRSELALCPYEHRATTKSPGSAVEARAPNQLAKSDGGVVIREKVMGQITGGAERVPKRRPVTLGHFRRI